MMDDGRWVLNTMFVFRRDGVNNIYQWGKKNRKIEQ